MSNHYACDVIQRSMKDAEKGKKSQPSRRSFNLDSGNCESETPPLIIIMAYVALGLLGIFVNISMRH